MSDIFYKDRVRIEDITDDCHVGFVYGGLKYKIEKASNNRFTALQRGEKINNVQGSVTSKRDYLKAIKSEQLKKAHIFKDEDSLNKWMDE